MIENCCGLMIFSYIMLILGIVVILFLLYVVFVVVMLDNKLVFEMLMMLIFGGYLLENMKIIWMNGVGVNSVLFWLMMFNSFIMVFVIMVGKIVVLMFLVFVIVWFCFLLCNLFFWMIFIILMLLVEVCIFLMVEVIVNFNMFDSYVGLMLLLMVLVIVIFLFCQFFMILLDELIEVVCIDGVLLMCFFCDIVLLLLKINFVVLFVIIFIYGWNQYLWLLLIIQDVNFGIVVVGIKGMIVIGEGIIQWNQVMVVMLLILILLVVIVLVMQCVFVCGLVDSEK